MRFPFVPFAFEVLYYLKADPAVGSPFPGRGEASIATDCLKARVVRAATGLKPFHRGRGVRWFTRSGLDPRKSRLVNLRLAVPRKHNL